MKLFFTRIQTSFVTLDSSKHLYKIKAMNSIFIIRHGETEWNKKNVFQGKSNSPLTKKGIEAAKSFAKSLKGKTIKHIYKRR